MSPASRPKPSDQLTGAEYAALVALLAIALVGTALFLSWAMEQRGLLAPGTTPRPSSPTADEPVPDFLNLDDGT